MEKLTTYLENNRNSKAIPLYFDIETLQFNELAGAEYPTDYKNVTYSVAVSWLNGGDVEYQIFPNFKGLFDTVTNVFKNRKTKPRINLNAHNTNKYDNHFMRKDLMYYYPHMKVKNMWMMTATDDANHTAYKLKDLTKEDKEGVILEKRIKSANNLELTFFLYGQQYFTTDNYMKTNASIAMLGKKLKRLGVLTDDELKTDFDYTKYNQPFDMTEDESRYYALEVFEQLSQDELTYIRNDVLILAKSVYHYSELFKGFDYSKMTFTSNILETYNTNNLTSFQLLNKIQDGDKPWHLKYTDYQFAGENFYDWLKPFYSGGLNFFNQKYVGQTIKTGVFGIDINSSYPYAMHHFKIPTFLKDYEAYGEETIKEINLSDDEYTLYRITKQTFDNLILYPIDSVLLKQILVKYYTSNDFVNINSYTFRMIENITGIKHTEIPVLSYVTFECHYFGSRDQIDEFYFIKTQGKEQFKLDYKDPYHISLTDEPNELILSDEEIDNSKVNLNGLYGIPALRPFFNLFRLSGDEYVNFENGHQNAERNIVFSIFVTSVSLWNLLDPLKYLTQQEIDENLLYTDTDSLYLKQQVKHKLPDSLFSDFSLGKWDLEHDNLRNFNVLNHKKYAYEVYNEKTKTYEIQVKSGGIPNDAYDTNMSFDEFVKTQFSQGVTIKNQKSILNNDGTISIYPSETDLEVGTGYRIVSYDKRLDRMKEKMLVEIKETFDGNYEDFLYIESNIGVFSLSELFPYENETDKKNSLMILEINHQNVKEKLNM